MRTERAALEQAQQIALTALQLHSEGQARESVVLFSNIHVHESQATEVWVEGWGLVPFANIF